MIAFGRTSLIALFFNAVVISGTGQAMANQGNVQQTSFMELSGWAEDDHVSALSTFVRFCKRPGTSDERFLLPSPSLCERALSALKEAKQTPWKAKAFFENNFTPLKFSKPGFVTGYYEPEVAASRTKSALYSAPLLAKPEGLEAVSDDNRPSNWPYGLTHGRRTAKGLQTLPDRGEIMDGALDAENLEFVWLKNPVDAFFIHVQGSARLRLEDGSVMRVGYAGKAGYPYTSIARVLVERGEGTPEELTMAGLRKWLAENPARRDELFRQNRSFIFFREIALESPNDGPIGSAELPLVAGRSLATDPDFVPFGLPVLVEAKGLGALFGDTNGTMARTFVSDDSGSAIKGAARGDIFVGSGAKAGELAGEIRHRAAMTVLVPKEAVDGYLKQINGQP